MFIPSPRAHFLLLFLTACISCTHPSDPTATIPDNDAALLAFGSCLRQWQPQPVWDTVQSLQPEAFVFLGDNMYSDVGPYTNLAEPERIGRAYADLGADEQFRRFRQHARAQGTALYATWDDHDYGINDGGADYPHKLASKRYFLDFFDLEKTATGGAEKAGVYQSHRLELNGLDVQLVLLDTRSFRSPLKKAANETPCRTATIANTDPAATVLGADQWRWLEQQLLQPADMRIIVSSIQVIPTQHCYEKWANFPLQRDKLFSLIRETRANGVILISGDRHLAEISRLPASVVGYPLYEITASGLNSAMGVSARFSGEENRYRQGKTVFTDNFGVISVQSQSQQTQLGFRIYEATGKVLRDYTVPLSQLAVQ